MLDHSSTAFYRNSSLVCWTRKNDNKKSIHGYHTLETVQKCIGLLVHCSLQTRCNTRLHCRNSIRLDHSSHCWITDPLIAIGQKCDIAANVALRIGIYKSQFWLHLKTRTRRLTFASLGDRNHRNSKLLFKNFVSEPYVANSHKQD